MPLPDEPEAVNPRRPQSHGEFGPSLVRMAIARMFVVAVLVGALLAGLRVWHTATVVLVVVVAAWLLGRVD
ncbi:MAG: hypothetical protein QOE80_2633 [Actinomycetota bacterium]|jgi:hypothetical protein|nr:hypothetical protein [Actinomycetota bacterium]